jgi:hypothetical protein
MAMDCQVADTPITPLILLVNFDTYQVRHHLGKSMVVIALYPHDLHVTLGIGKLANVAEELPVFFLEAAEIQITKNIAEQDQAAEGGRLHSV